MVEVRAVFDSIISMPTLHSNFIFLILISWWLSTHCDWNLNYVLLLMSLIGAVLAAWMRLKYPHIAIGALASSAPILQFEDIVPSTIFYDLVSDDFRVCILLSLVVSTFLYQPFD
jgi:hypothetical protein